jgi:transcriptional regulator with GAF, ATPase, and Fis domain
VYPIEMPPLRERKADIPILAEAFLQDAGRRLKKSFGPLPSAVIEALQEYNWPGNVRELENVIGRAAISSYGPVLQLPEGWSASAIGAALAASDKDAPFLLPAESAGPAVTLEEVERKRITEVLQQMNWRIEGPSGAALILGLHPNTLRSRLRKLGIQRPAKPRNLVV